MADPNTTSQCSDTGERYWFQNEPVSSVAGPTQTTIQPHPDLPFGAGACPRCRLLVNEALVLGCNCKRLKEWSAESHG